jgi:NAD(P)-dependent dehydrogenase (short-subunit alcohol dehydrogenase family)
MSLLALIKGQRGPSGFGFASTAEDVTNGLDLTGKTILVTGINSGLGQESGRVLSMRGAHIIGLARTLEKAREGCASLSGPSTAVACELSEPNSVRAAVEEIKANDQTIDVLLCNAGIMALPDLHKSNGYELQFFTNHIGHFMLVTGLLECLADDGRVVMLSSAAHTMPYKEGIQFDNLSGDDGYTGFRAYGQSKLSNVLFANELNKRFEGTSKTAYSVHPGGIATNLGRHMQGPSTYMFALVGWIGMKSVPQGAATQCYVATNPDAPRHSGEYFVDSNVKKKSKHGQNDAMGRQLWQKSEEIVAQLN